MLKIYTGSSMYCAPEKKWKVLGPTDEATTELFDASALTGIHSKSLFKFKYI